MRARSLLLTTAFLFGVLVSSLPAQAADQCNAVVAFSQTASAKLITGASGLRVYICGIIIWNAGTAQSVSLVEGTGTVCGTGTVGLIGGTSASVSLPINNGFTAVSGEAWLRTQTAGDDVCLLQSGSTNISGTVSYRQAN